METLMNMKLWILITAFGIGFTIGYIRCYFVLRKIISRMGKAELWEWIQNECNRRR
ncbi:MAG: hypothetical protein H6Q72_951 [Firmicutes bacterium]|nr:hypothetical protein [Bacillota bacterium]